MAKKRAAEIRFNYVEEDGYRVSPVAGVVGHVAQAMGFGVFATFYAEYLPTPEYATRAVAEDGSVGPEVPSDASGETRHVTRRVLTSVVMSPETARNVAKWLQTRADEADLLRAAAVKAPK